MKQREVEGALEVKVRFEVPSDRAVPLAVNRGNPAVLADPGADFSQAIALDGEGLVADRSRRSGKRKFLACGRGVAMGLHDRIKGDPTGQRQRAGGSRRPRASSRSASASGRRADPYAELKTRIHHAVIATLGAELFSTEANEDLTSASSARSPSSSRSTARRSTREERRQLVREITDDILGYGPLEPFLRDDSVTEVMVNAFDRIYVERHGKLERTHVAFADNAHLLRIIDKIVSQVGRRIDESSPMVDARLPDGSRVNAIIPPLALRGPDADDPEVRARPVHDERPDRVRDDLRRRRRSSSPPA